jgi:hypothetical protein
MTVIPEMSLDDIVMLHQKNRRIGGILLRSPNLVQPISFVPKKIGLFLIKNLLQFLAYSN